MVMHQRLQLRGYGSEATVKKNTIRGYGLEATEQRLRDQRPIYLREGASGATADAPSVGLEGALEGALEGP